MNRCRTQKGVVLVICMIFLCIFSALAVSLASMSNTNVQLAENQRKANRARACAESGLAVTRFWLNQVAVSGPTSADQVFTKMADDLQTKLAADDITNIVPTYDGSAKTITIPDVTLDSTTGRSFSAVIGQIDSNTIQADITGSYGSITKTIRVNYIFETRRNPVFDYGVATKGPLHLVGNTELGGVNIASESDIYIESDVTEETLSIIGNSQISGNVSFTSSEPDIELSANASIGGETGDAALDHVHTGIDPVEFPVPNPGYFEHYVADDINYPSTETTFENIRIPPNTDPSFEGGVTLKGIVFIETPNIITFTGNSTITGIIVGDGDFEDNSGTNQINFIGNVDSYPVTDLPSEFGQLRNETGTFLMAPGFDLSFGGSFATLNGAIASNGIEFYGNAGGIIEGSVINYSDEPMTLTGNSDLFFNRSGTVQVPAGFVPEIILEYDPLSYSEIEIVL